MWLGRWQKTQKCCSLPSFLWLWITNVPFYSLYFFFEKKTNESPQEIVPIWLFLFISFIFFIISKDTYQYQEFFFLTSNFVYYGWVPCLYACLCSQWIPSTKKKVCVASLETRVTGHWMPPASWVVGTEPDHGATSIHLAVIFECLIWQQLYCIIQYSNPLHCFSITTLCIFQNLFLQLYTILLIFIIIIVIALENFFWWKYFTFSEDIHEFISYVNKGNCWALL